MWHTDQNNVQRTINAVTALSSEFSKTQYRNVVTSIQPLNEPAGWYSDELLQTAKEFYVTTYNYARYHNTQYPNALLYALHDAFQPLTTWRDFLSWKYGYEYVAFDTHIYTM